MSKNSVLEQALLQVKNLEDAVKQNAKGILESSMRQELKNLLKEAEEEEEVEVPDNDEEEETDSEVPDMGGDEEGLESGEDDHAEPDADNFGGESDMDADNEFGGEDDLSTEDEDDEDVLDMTGATDSEVLKVFKAMKPEDGIVVKRDGNKLEVNTGSEEFIIQLDSDEPETDMSGEGEFGDEEMPSEFGDESGEESDEELPAEFGDESGEESDEEMPAEFGGDSGEESEDDEDDLSGELAEEEDNVYEIELDECDEELEECGGGNKLPEGDVDEAARTKWNIHGDKGGADRAGIKSKKLFKAGSGKINEELETLRKQNVEYRKALNLFKEKLNEVAVFNANLAYATRLFTEQSTTKQEKLNILKRFDSVSTLTEAKGLYKSIKAEFENKKPISESVINKISNTPSSSSSKEVLSETKAYENPQFKRMKELMNKIK